MIKIIDTNTNRTMAIYDQAYNERLNGHKIKDFKEKCLLQTYFKQKDILIPKHSQIKQAKNHIRNNTLNSLKIVIDNSISLL